jgi:hypothetical protein
MSSAKAQDAEKGFRLGPEFGMVNPIFRPDFAASEDGRPVAL